MEVQDDWDRGMSKGCWIERFKVWGSRLLEALKCIYLL